MKTKEGKHWYVDDLHCYTEDYLQEIILDLLGRIPEEYTDVGDDSSQSVPTNEPNSAKEALNRLRSRN